MPATEQAVRNAEQRHKQQEVLRVAEKLLSKDPAPDWITFYREIFGLSGVVRELFPTREALAEFERSETCHAIHQMLAGLWTNGPPPPNAKDSTRVITVRLPASLHEALQIEAHEHRTSVNKLCISKLVQYIDHGKVPGKPPRRPKPDTDGDGADL